MLVSVLQVGGGGGPLVAVFSFLSVELFVLGGRDVAELVVQPLVVGEADPGEGLVLDPLEAPQPGRLWQLARDSPGEGMSPCSDTASGGGRDEDSDREPPSPTGAGAVAMLAVCLIGRHSRSCQ